MYMEECLAETMISILPQTMGWLRLKVSKYSEPDLTLAQFRILSNINRGLNTTTLIAKHHGVSQPAMSQMVDLLVEKKLILKKINTKDKRQSILSLSSKGKRQLFIIIEKVKVDVAEQLSSLSKTQQKKIQQALVLLYSCMGDLKCESVS